MGGLRRQIPLGEIIDTASFSLKASMYKVSPGIVRKFYPSVKGKSPALVDVEVAVHDVRFDTDTGARVSEPWPILPQVPVGMLRLGPYVVSGPLAVGQGVTLVSYDLDPTKHRLTGHAEDPIDTRRHGGSYWLALPIDITDPAAVSDAGNCLVLGMPDGSQLQVGPDFVSVGAANAGDFAALASKVNHTMGLLQKLAKALGAVPPAGTLAPLSATVTAAKALDLGMVTDVASTKVKIAP